VSGVRLELNWPNKDKFLLVPKNEHGKPVWVERTHPAAHEVRLTAFAGEHGVVNDKNPYADHLLFTGDSLDVLRVLNEVPEFHTEYRGKIRLIYNDPPFNTGRAFTHYDDWMEHSTWLSLMRDRLLLMKELLAPDGSIWMHLDDGEAHRMRCLLDEIFGAGNFVAEVSWRSTDSSSNNAKGFAKDHNSILVYGKQANWRPNQLPDSEKSGHYKNPNGDPRGPWYDGRDVQNPKLRPNLMYNVETPSGKIIKHPKNGWRWSRETLDEKLASGEVFFNSNETAIKRISYLWEQEGLPPSDYWYRIEETGSSRGAKNHLKTLFPSYLTPDLFDTPKPELLMQKILMVGSNAGDIVLDVFGGSGATAAVAHKMGRRWITAEILPETVEAFTLPRLEKVINGEDAGGMVLLAEWATNGKFAKAVAAQLGFGFEFAAAPFCGSRNRMRLAVIDGVLGSEEVREIASYLTEGERVTIVAKVVLPGAEEALAGLAKGSRIRKAPRDLLIDSQRRSKRKESKQ
jgi:adenine-specific DNA-methyltransferase